MHPQALLDLTSTLLREVLKFEFAADNVVSTFFRLNRNLGTKLLTMRDLSEKSVKMILG